MFPSIWACTFPSYLGFVLTKLVAVWLKYQPIVDNFRLCLHPCAMGHRKRGPGVPHKEPFLRPEPLFLRLGRTEGPFWGTMGPQGATWRPRGTHEHRKGAGSERYGAGSERYGPTSTENSIVSNDRNPKTELPLQREHRFQRSQGSQTKKMRGFPPGGGGGVPAGMEAPIQPPLSTRPADQRTHTRLHTPGDPTGSADIYIYIYIYIP